MYHSFIDHKWVVNKSNLIKMAPIIQICGRCGKEVYHAEKKVAINKVWHEFCFNCVLCHKRLNSQNFSTHQGEIYCQTCYIESTTYEAENNSQPSSRRRKSRHSSNKSKHSSENISSPIRAEIQEFPNLKPSQLKSTIRHRQESTRSTKDNVSSQIFDNTVCSDQNCPVHDQLSMKNETFEEKSQDFDDIQCVCKKILPSFLCRCKNCVTPKNAAYCELVYNENLSQRQEEFASERSPRKMVESIERSSKIPSERSKHHTRKGKEEILFISESGTTRIVKVTSPKKKNYKSKGESKKKKSSPEKSAKSSTKTYNYDESDEEIVHKSKEKEKSLKKNKQEDLNDSPPAAKEGKSKFSTKILSIFTSKHFGSADKLKKIEEIDDNKPKKWSSDSVITEKRSFVNEDISDQKVSKSDSYVKIENHGKKNEDTLNLHETVDIESPEHKSILKKKDKPEKDKKHKKESKKKDTTEIKEESLKKHTSKENITSNVKKKKQVEDFASLDIFTTPAVHLTSKGDNTLKKGKNVEESRHKTTKKKKPINNDRSVDEISTPKGSHTVRKKKSELHTTVIPKSLKNSMNISSKNLQHSPKKNKQYSKHSLKKKSKRSSSPDKKKSSKRFQKKESAEKDLFTTAYNIYPESKEEIAIKKATKSPKRKVSLEDATSKTSKSKFKDSTKHVRRKLNNENESQKFVVTAEVSPKTNKIKTRQQSGETYVKEEKTSRNDSTKFEVTAEVLPTKNVSMKLPQTWSQEKKIPKNQFLLHSSDCSYDLSKNYQFSNKYFHKNVNFFQSPIAKKILGTYTSITEDENDESLEKQLRNNRFSNPFCSKLTSKAPTTVVHPSQESVLYDPGVLLRKPTRDGAVNHDRKFGTNYKRYFQPSESATRKNMCRRCKNKVYAVEKMFAAGGVFHDGCFTCCVCEKHLDSLSVLARKSEIFCKHCYMKYFGPHTYGFGLCPNLYCF